MHIVLSSIYLDGFFIFIFDFIEVVSIGHGVNEFQQKLGKGHTTPASIIKGVKYE